MISPREEWERFKEGAAAIDKQTAIVLTLVCVLGLWPTTFGKRGMFRMYIAPVLGIDHQGFVQIGWMYGSTAVVLFALPVLLLMVGFGKKPSEIGLGLGDWRFALAMLALWIPIATVGTWFLSDLPSFGQDHPYYKIARRDVVHFVIYEAMFLLYWLGWEYLYRGFALFGTKHTLGIWAVFVQMLPFAAFHMNKPWPEAYLSVPGGIVLGLIVWRSGAFWVAVPLHWWQMFSMDVFCTLRRIGDVDGVGPGAFMAALRSLG